jgi:nicotinamidase-related amidase
MKRALLVIDMLNDFAPGGSLPVKDVHKIVPKIKDVLDFVRKDRDWNVIYLNDSHTENDPEFNYWPKHAVKGTIGAKVIEQIKPNSFDKVIEKSTYNGFYHADLENLLRKLEVNEIFFAGVLTDICVYNTLLSAFERGYNCYLLSDATATSILPGEEKYWNSSDEKQKFWVDNIKIKKLANVIDTSKILNVE